MPTRSPASFDETYLGTPPWDIGEPQPAVVRLCEEGAFRGRVLDSGCGSGENALHLAARGLDVCGVDASPRAIAKAQAKARERQVQADFRVHDALALGGLGVRFDTVLDSGLFHVFDDPERARYVASLAAVTTPGATVYILAFSDLEPIDWGGPRRIARQEFTAAFHDGWRVRWVEPARFATNLDVTGHAWLAAIDRTTGRPEGPDLPAGSIR